MGGVIANNNTICQISISLNPYCIGCSFLSLHLEYNISMNEDLREKELKDKLKEMRERVTVGVPRDFYAFHFEVVKDYHFQI